MSRMADVDQLLNEIGKLRLRVEALEKSNKEQGEALSVWRQRAVRFQSLVDAAGDLIWEIDAHGCYAYVSSKARDLLGYEPEELVGKRPCDFMPQDEAESAASAFNKIIESHQSFSGLERTSLCKDGRVVGLVNSGTPLFDEAGTFIAYRGFDRDITKAKKAEDELRVARDYLRKIVDNVYDAIMIHDGKGEILDVNDNMLKFHEISREAAIGKRVSDFLPTDKPVDELIPVWQKVLSGEDLLFEWKVKRLTDGALFDVEVFVTRLGSPDSGLILANVRDITERKRREEALQRLNRELRAISNCNQALMRATDEQTLLNEICRIVCVDGGYHMAWVGYVENDEAKAVRPVARGGLEDEYVLEAGITWADTELGRGPKGAAIRTGQAVCIQNYETDPRVAPWRERALQQGYRSCISLPLKDEHTATFGALTIFSAEPDIFTPHEIRLMEELAGDLAFGINSLRARADRARAEESLRISRILLSEAMDLAKIVHWEADIEGKALVFNDPFYELYGTTAEQEGGYWMTMDEYNKRFIHPDYSDLFWKMVEESVSRKDLLFVNDEDLRIIRRDGEIRYVRVRARIAKNASGEIVRVHGTNQDITERKRMEDELKESEEKFRLLFERSADTVFLLYRGRFVDCNEAAVSLMECSGKEEIVGLTPIDFSPEKQPDGRSSYEKTLEILQTTRGAGVNHFEWLHRTKTGKDLWVEVSHTVVPIEGRNIIYTTLRDITARKRAEDELRLAHQRLSDIIEFLPDATFVVDHEKKVVSWNLACEEMTGVKKEEIVGKGDYEYAVPFYEERRPVLVDYVISGSDDLEGKYLSVKRWGNLLSGESFAPMMRNGKGAYLACRASPLYDKDGDIVGAIENLRDITELKHLETQLRHSQKMEAIGTLAGGIAHDFNNILTVLAGYASLLRMDLTDQKLCSHADRIISAATKATDLVRNLLIFSRQKNTNLAPVGLNSAITQAETLLTRLVTEDITIKTMLAANDMMVIADPTQIDQILFNLVANARDAMPQGGVLTIETKEIKLTEEFKRLYGYGQPGRYALISVSDTGAGMDAATRERIFDPFFTTKEPGKGTGLGLSTVYGIVQQHNGYITVYSEVNMGTTFHVYFPLARKAGAEEKQAAPVQTRKGTETILVAEDNEMVRGLICNILNDHGYKTVEAIDGEDAIHQHKKAKKIDLLILDSVMPNKNGRQAYNEIIAVHPHIRTIFISGHTRDVVLDKGVEEGKVHFLQKPIMPEVLLIKVREVLDVGNQEDS